jgi:penicillin-binding protein 1A
MREAFSNSWNLSSIRTLREVGIGNTIRHLRKFGFDDRAMPVDPTLALGSVAISPLNLASGYSVFANGGFRVFPYFIERVEDASGEVLYPLAPGGPRVVCDDAANPIRDCDGEKVISCDGPDLLCKIIASQETPTEPVAPELVSEATDLYPEVRRAERVIPAQNAYLITDVMKDVVRFTSGALAGRELKRRDLAGKTGTTNDARDAWFAGFNTHIVATAWVGFDDSERPLGGREQGGVTAIPMWISYMFEALAGRPESAMERPPGIVEVRINPDTGKIASDANPNGRFELFRIGHLPEREPDSLYLGNGTEGAGSRPGTSEPIF